MSIDNSERVRREVKHSCSVVVDRVGWNDAEIAIQTGVGMCICEIQIEERVR